MIIMMVPIVIVMPVVASVVRHRHNTTGSTRYQPKED